MPACSPSTYALLAGPDAGWGSGGVLAAWLASGILLAGFVLLQRHRGEHALIDLRLFRIPSFTASMALSFCARVTTLGLMPFLVLWLQGILGSDPTEAGLQLLPMTVLIMLAASVSGTLQKRLPSNAVIALGFVLIGAGAVALLLAQPGGSWLAALPALALFGLGAGLSFPPLLGTAVSVVPPHRSGMASGMANTFFPLGTAGGVAAFGALLSARIHADLPATRLAELGVNPARAAEVYQAIDAGQFDRLAELAPPAARAGLTSAAHSAFMSGLSTLALAIAGVSFVAVLVAWRAIRAQDRYDR
ncbi:MAG: MFS transporter [Pseudonocardiaceae bacterium]|nr:MFS transporter [Pseudonocardiaceae bacterium]